MYEIIEHNDGWHILQNEKTIAVCPEKIQAHHTILALQEYSDPVWVRAVYNAEDARIYLKQRNSLLVALKECLADHDERMSLPYCRLHEDQPNKRRVFENARIAIAAISEEELE